MKSAIHAAVFLLFLGSATCTFAQQEEKGHAEGAKPAQQHAPSARPTPQAKPAQQARPAPQQRAQQTKPAPQQQRVQQAKPTPQQHAQQSRPATQQPQHAQQAKPVQRQQAQHAQQARPATRSTHQSQASNARGGAHGRISDAHYRTSFGSSHRFHINQGDFNNRRFQYGGYSFGFVDPWPVGWLYTDDVYVEYIDGGYYMFDPYHPGIRLSINIM